MHHLSKTGMKRRDGSSALIENIVTFYLCFQFTAFIRESYNKNCALSSSLLYSLLLLGSIHGIAALDLLLHLLELLKTF